MKITKPIVITSLILSSLLVSGCTGDDKDQSTPVTNTSTSSSSSSKTPQPSASAPVTTEEKAVSTDDKDIYNDVETLKESTKHGTVFFNVDYRDIEVPQELVQEYGDVAKNIPRDILFALFESMGQSILQTEDAPEEFQEIAINELGDIYLTYKVKQQIFDDIKIVESNDANEEERFDAWARTAGTAFRIPSGSLSIDETKIEYNKKRLWTKSLYDIAISKDDTGKVIVKMNTLIEAPVGFGEEYEPIADMNYTYELILNGDRWIISNVEARGANE